GQSIVLCAGDDPFGVTRSGQADGMDEPGGRIHVVVGHDQMGVVVPRELVFQKALQLAAGPVLFGVRHGGLPEPVCRGDEGLQSMPGTVLEKPQSTCRISPVTPLARSDSRKDAALPTSSMVTLRPSGDWDSTYFSMLEKSRMPLAARVLIGPAEMPLARRPCLPRDLAR